MTKLNIILNKISLQFLLIAPKVIKHARQIKCAISSHYRLLAPAHLHVVVHEFVGVWFALLFEGQVGEELAEDEGHLFVAFVVVFFVEEAEEFGKYIFVYLLCAYLRLHDRNYALRRLQLHYQILIQQQLYQLLVEVILENVSRELSEEDIFEVDGDYLADVPVLVARAFEDESFEFFNNNVLVFMFACETKHISAPFPPLKIRPQINHFRQFGHDKSAETGGRYCMRETGEDV